MSPLNIILNVLWILTGGIWMAVAWLVAAVIMAITIIGLPWARHSGGADEGGACCLAKVAGERAAKTSAVATAAAAERVMVNT